MMDDEDDTGGKVTGVDELEGKPRDIKEKNGISLFTTIICLFWFWFGFFIVIISFRFIPVFVSFFFFLGVFLKLD